MQLSLHTVMLLADLEQDLHGQAFQALCWLGRFEGIFWAEEGRVKHVPSNHKDLYF